MRLAAGLRRVLWLAPRGHGRPVPLRTWEHQYQTGGWDYLDGLDELSHYMVIVGYATLGLERPDILDVGCGHGRLLQLLPASSFRSYLGVDFSTEALARAGRVQLERACFVQGDFETWTPPHPMDVIVFNESLYNSRRPAELVKRYSQHLKADGRIIISMYQALGGRFIWGKIDSLLRRMDGVRIRHDNGQVWRVGLFATRLEGGRESL